MRLLTLLLTVFHDVNRRPNPFKVKITPRFPEAAMMLELGRESLGLPAFKLKTP